MFFRLVGSFGNEGQKRNIFKINGDCPRLGKVYKEYRALQGRSTTQSSRPFSLIQEKFGIETIAEEWRATPSKYAGVHMSLPTGQVRKSNLSCPWKASYKFEGSEVQLGSFQTEEEAAHAYDEMAAQFGWPKNFPSKDEARAVRGSATGSSSRFRGVSKEGNKWKAYVDIGKKTISLGRHATEEEAARAADVRLAELGRSLNFPDEAPDGYVQRKRPSHLSKRADAGPKVMSSDVVAGSSLF